MDDHDPKVPVEYKTQASASMPPLTPREGKSPKTPATPPSGKDGKEATPTALALPHALGAGGGSSGS